MNVNECLLYKHRFLLLLVPDQHLHLVGKSVTQQRPAVCESHACMLKSVQGHESWQMCYTVIDMEDPDMDHVSE